MNNIYDFLWRIINETNLGGLGLFLVTIALIQGIVHAVAYVSEIFKKKEK